MNALVESGALALALSPVTLVLGFNLLKLARWLAEKVPGWIDALLINDNPPEGS